MAGSIEAAYAADFVDYLNAAQSPFHCVAEVKRRLTLAGFVELDERRPWVGTVVAGGKHFVSRNGSSLIAFAVGGKFDAATSGVIVLGAHTDSPCPKLKPVSSLEKEGHVMLGVVGYGGGLWHTWFDRDLTVVGRALVKGADGRVSPRLVRVAKALCRIPTLAIHLASAEERAAFKPNLEAHFPPLLATAITDALWRKQRSGGGAAAAAAAAGSEGKGGSGLGHAGRHPPLLLAVVADALGLSAGEAVVDFELQLADTQPSALLGACDEFVSSGRLDNQGSCYAVTTALVESLKTPLEADTSIRMISMFDHEEVGSLSAQGADSPFFEDVLKRAFQALHPSSSPSSSSSSSLDHDGFVALKARSFQVSSDMAHAVHPNYADKHDPKNRPRLGGGLVIKHNANQRYATNSIGASLVRRFAEAAQVPVQEFCVKACNACGTTIGPITAGGTGIRTVDVGPPQLSMHSCREMMAAADVDHAVKLLTAALCQYGALAPALEVEGCADPFWGTPGNGWGQLTA